MGPIDQPSKAVQKNGFQLEEKFTWEAASLTW